MADLIKTPTVDNKLPPLPASDPESIAKNRYQGFYGIGSRTYWKDAEVTLNKIKDFEKCSHYFTQHGSQIMCSKCNAGFFGPGIGTQDGRLLINNREAVL